jgi:hypothetical protein
LSLQVLDFLTRHAWFEPVLVVGTYRDAELEAVTHPGRPLLLPLLGWATQLRLTGLDHDGVHALPARAGCELDHARVAEVARRARGQPVLCGADRAAGRGAEHGYPGRRVLPGSEHPVHFASDSTLAPRARAVRLPRLDPERRQGSVTTPAAFDLAM